MANAQGQSTKMSGTQSVARAVLLIRSLAARGKTGWRLVDLAEHCHLDKGTAHRILSYLVQERFVRQRTADRHYLPGPMLFELGFALQSRAEFVSACNEPLQRLARRAGDIAFLYLRSGDEFVCAKRVGVTSTSYAIESGTRRPLILSAGGMAIITALPAKEAKRIVAQNLQQLPRYDVTGKRNLMKMLKLSYARGYGVNLNVVSNVSAFAVPIRDSVQSPFASISVAGRLDQYGSVQRAREVVSLLRQEAEDLGQKAMKLFRE